MSPLKQFVIIPLGALAICYIAIISIDNGMIVWNPVDWVAETAYLINLKPTTVPTTIPAPSEEEKQLVDPKLYLAFYLIQRDPRFGYLAQFALKAKIPIMSTSDMRVCGGGDKEACYTNHSSGCYLGHPGTIYLDGNFAQASVRWFPAALMVHELTHAWNRLEKSSYYCAGTYYLSDEIMAFINEENFIRQYERWGILDYFNRQGTLNEYCLYSQVKQGYQKDGPVDDVNLKPTDNISPLFCPLYSDLTSF